MMRYAPTHQETSAHKVRRAPNPWSDVRLEDLPLQPLTLEPSKVNIHVRPCL